MQFETPILITAGRTSVLAFSDQPPDRTDSVRRDGILVNSPSYVPDWLTAYLDPNKGLVRAPANAEFQALPRTIITIAHRGYPVGYVFAVDPDQRIPSDWHLKNERTLTAVGLEIELSKSQSNQIQLTVRSALSPDPATRRVGIDSLGSLRTFEEATRIRVLVSELDDREVSISRLAWVGSVSDGRAWAELDDRLVAIINDDEHDPIKEIERLQTTLRQSRPFLRTFHGVGGQVHGLDAARQSYIEGLGALRVARVLRDGSSVAYWDKLGSWRTLVALGKERGLRTLDPRVARLIDHERDDNIAVLREYLERNGEVEKIASELHMHRSTIYSRLKRIESKYTLDLNDAEDRLTTVVGLRLAQLYA
ncbi:helix-turn-helix domain-containing protein [Rhodococcus sp. DMU1]|uniref:PucR family transcriptional regulator n=1 Tax=Rhodococcus sp. DMU1 TaxID=2722825 RepID=UPI00143E7438|nr:helix-turn-helix domain-containing protein [Rhodococcus sp. DMU1]QIX53692.1 hypothetical protein HFP48_29135 [Rhodococcus sp. DMU1]